MPSDGLAVEDEMTIPGEGARTLEGALRLPRPEADPRDPTVLTGNHKWPWLWERNRQGHLLRAWRSLSWACGCPCGLGTGRAAIPAATCLPSAVLEGPTTARGYRSLGAVTMAGHHEWAVAPAADSGWGVPMRSPSIQEDLPSWPPGAAKPHSSASRGPRAVLWHHLHGPGGQRRSNK